MLAYFINLIAYLGIYLLLFDMDIITIFLWLTYGGIIILFFMYTLLWSETQSINIFDKWMKFTCFIIFLILYFNSLELKNFFDIRLFNSFYENFYNLLNYDDTEELENVGWLLIYIASYYFLVIIYLLLFSCCAIILIVTNSKKIRYYFYMSYAALSHVNILKFQNYYLQDFFSLKRNNRENYTINNNFWRFRPRFRRV
jgi:hypothetical protein